MRRALFAALLAVALCGPGCAHVPEGPPPDYEGTLANLQPAGDLVPSAYRGRVILVQFFATWCFPCLGAFPGLKKLEDEFAGRGLTVVTVGMDLEGAKTLIPFAIEERPPFPILIADEAIRSGQSPFGKIPTVPVSYLIGRDGKLLAAWQGLVKETTLREALDEALSR